MVTQAILTEVAELETATTTEDRAEMVQTELSVLLAPDLTETAVTSLIRTEAIPLTDLILLLQIAAETEAAADSAAVAADLAAAVVSVAAAVVEAEVIKI